MVPKRQLWGADVFDKIINDLADVCERSILDGHPAYVDVPITTAVQRHAEVIFGEEVYLSPRPTSVSDDPNATAARNILRICVGPGN